MTITSSSLPSPFNGNTLHEETKIISIVDKSLETEVAANDDVALSLRHLLHGGISSPEISHGLFELAEVVFNLYQYILRPVSPNKDMRS